MKKYRKKDGNSLIVAFFEAGLPDGILKLSIPVL
jgi:hypothetical protein